MTETEPKRGKAKLAGRALLLAGIFAAGAVAGGAGAVLAALELHPGAAAPPPPEAREAKLDYVEIDNAFTSNLADTGRYLQLHIAVSTRGGPAVVAAINRHKPAVVSAVLGVLGDATETDIAGRAAKDRLRAGIKRAINDTLIAKAGSGGVDEVFITSLVVQ